MCSSTPYIQFLGLASTNTDWCQATIISPKSSVMLCNLAWWNAMQFMSCMHILLDKKLTLQWFELHRIYIIIVWLYNFDVYLIIFSVLECTRNALLPFSTWKRRSTDIRPPNPYIKHLIFSSRRDHITGLAFANVEGATPCRSVGLLVNQDDRFWKL